MKIMKKYNLGKGYLRTMNSWISSLPQMRSEGRKPIIGDEICAFVLETYGRIVFG